MIQLRRKVPVRTFDAEATVAVGRERPEFLAVARLAADFGGPIDAEDVSRELLAGYPAHVGRRVIERAVAMGLLERQGSTGPAKLSSAGAVALEQGEVLVREEGTWRFFIVEDPLIDVPLLHAERIESMRAKDERGRLFEDRKSGATRPGQGATRPPQLLGSASGPRVFSSLATARLFQPIDVAARGFSGASADLELVLEHSPDAGRPSVSLRGHLDAASPNEKPRSVDRRLGPVAALEGVRYETLWLELASTATQVSPAELSEWRRRADGQVVPVAFGEELDSTARTTMRRPLAVPEVGIAGLGRFEPSVLENAAIVPRSAEDARRWAEWLAWNAIDDYCTPERLHAIAREVSQRFPIHKPPLPGPDEVLQHAKSSPVDPRSRFVLAPADLGLWRQP